VSSVAPPMEVETAATTGGTAAPDFAEVWRTLQGAAGTGERVAYRPDIIALLVRPDGTTDYLVFEVKQANASSLMSLRATRPLMTPEEFDEVLYQRGILAGLPRPRPATPQENARLRALPPGFRRRKSLLTISREARNRR
jgi:hypothetical protein